MYRSSSSSYGGRDSGRPSYGRGGGDFGGGGRRMNDDIILKKPVWNSSTMKPFEKEFYKESSLVLSRPQSEATDFLRNNNVTVSGNKFVKPVLAFNELNIPDTILNRMKDARYDKPTPIQSMCWPTLMSGLDMVGIAQTGSGKTLGFILPILVHIMNNTRYMRSFTRDDTPGPIALVLAPTRELAIQIQQVAEEFGNLSGIKNVVIYGGASKGPQAGQIRRGAEIYIATPGRLLDFMKEGTASLSRCTYLVLDEADRMLDMGFEPQIRKIIEQIRPDRQTTMFSATWPKEVRKLAEDFISNYTHITINASDFLTANPNIKQIVDICDEGQKENRLKEILNEIMIYKDSKAIIFAETKKRVDNFSKFIREQGFHCLTIHGDKKQQEREWVLNEFKKKARSILCATDVAARGLDVSDIKYVINIDYPSQTEDYIHRIGRTARSSNTGTSYTLFTRDNSRHASQLVEVLREANQYIPDALLNMCRGGRGGGGGYSRYGSSSYSRPRYNSPPKSYGYSDYSQPRKRESDDNTNGTNGAGADNASRTKKFRWDEAPSGTAAPYSNGSAAPPPPPSSAAYGPYPAKPPASATVSQAAAPASSSSSSHTVVPAAAYGTDYASLYNIQYYQAVAAAAASNGSWQAAGYPQWQPAPTK